MSTLTATLPAPDLTQSIIRRFARRRLAALAVSAAILADPAHAAIALDVFLAQAGHPGLGQANGDIDLLVPQGRDHVARPDYDTPRTPALPGRRGCA